MSYLVILFIVAAAILIYKIRFNKNNKMASGKELSNIVESADNYRYGWDGHAIDEIKALSLYEKAVQEGCSDACKEIASMYDELDPSISIQWLKKGIEMGSAECIGSLAEHYTCEGEIEKAIKLWEKYFTVENILSSKVNHFYGNAYIYYVKNSDFPLTLREQLYSIKDTLISRSKETLETKLNGKMRYTDKHYHIVSFYEQLEAFDSCPAVMADRGTG